MFSENERLWIRRWVRRDSNVFKSDWKWVSPYWKREWNIVSSGYQRPVSYDLLRKTKKDHIIEDIVFNEVFSSYSWMLNIFRTLCKRFHSHFWISICFSPDYEFLLESICDYCRCDDGKISIGLFLEVSEIIWY